MSLYRFLGRRSRDQSTKGRRTAPTRLTLESLEARTLVTADLLSGVPLSMYGSASSTSSDQTDVPLSITSAQSGTSQANAGAISQEFLTITDANDKPITGQLAIGQQFWIDYSVQDLRSSLSDAGIALATTNITYDPALVSPAGAVVAAPNYPLPNASHGNTSTPGLLQSVGGFEPENINQTPIFAPLGSGVQLVARVPMEVIGAGPITFSTQIPPAPSGSPTSESMIVVDPKGTAFASDTQLAGVLADSEIQGASVTINAPLVSLSGGEVTAGASASSVPFTVTMTPQASQPVTVDYQTQILAGDNAVSGTDFTGTTTGTVVIPANQSSATFQIPVAANTQAQPAKTFHVSLTGIDPASAGQATINTAASTALGTINFPAPTVTVQSASVTETTSTATQMSFQVSLSGTSAQPVTVQYHAVSLTGDTANGGTDISAAGVDYFSADSTTNAAPLVINPGSTTGTITIPIAAEQGGADKTFHLVLTSASGATLATSPQAVEAVGTIVDDVNVSVASIGAASAANTAGTKINFPVTLSPGSNQPVTLDYQTQISAGDTAVSGTDFGASGTTTQVTGQITFAANQTTGMASIPIIGSSIYQPDKTFHVMISVDPASVGKATISNASALGTITSSVAKPTATITDSSLTESASGAAATMTFPVSLSAKSGQDVTITYNTVSETGDNAMGGANISAQGVDYQTVTGGTLVIPANSLSGTISVPIAAELAGPDRTFHVVLTGATGGGQLGTTTSAQGTIQIQGKVSQPTASIQLTAAMVEPTSNGQFMPFTVTLSAPSRVPVTFTYTTTGQSAVAGTDYGTAGQTSEVTSQVTIQPFQTSGTFTIPLLVDAALAQDRSFQVNITALPAGASNATIATGQGQSTGTIVFNPIFASIVGSSVVETTSAVTSMSFTVSLTNSSNAPTTSTQDITINYQTVSQTGDTAVGGMSSATPGVDYQTVTGQSLLIKAGESSGTISIPIGAELAGATSKTFHVELLNSSVGAVLGNNSVAQGTISETIPSPAASVGSATVANAATGATLSIPITLSAMSAQPITIDYATKILSGDTAVAGTDYGTAGQAAEVTGKVTIPAGALSANISIPVIGNTVYEPPKTLHVGISVDPNSTNFATIASNGATGQATITSGVPAPTVSIQNAKVTESTTTATTMNFTVSLLDANNAPTVSGQDVTITYSTQSLPATATQSLDNAIGGPDITVQGTDYQSVTAGTVVIPAGQSSGTISIPIAAELAGVTKTFHVIVTAAVTGDATLSVPAPSALGEIVDTVPQPTASVQNASLTAPSTGGATMPFVVTLSAPSSLPITLDYSTKDITAVTGQDYTSPAVSQFTIAAFQTSGTFTVPIFADGNLSVDKTFSVTLSTLPSGASNATVAGAPATGTILPPIGSFSGAVFVDTNNDGVQEPGEHGLAGVTVNLTGATTSGQPENMSVTTGANGAYSFQSLLPGTYAVTDIPPTQYIVGHTTPATGVIATSNVFSFDMSGGSNVVNNMFGERGLQPQLISKRLFLGSVIH